MPFPPQHLRQIWDLSDADNDNKLSMAEFCVGMHLIICASKKGLAIPTSVPRTLVNTSFASPPNGSSGTPVFQPPARPSPSAKPFSTPYAGPTLPPLGIAATDLGDAFRQAQILVEHVVSIEHFIPCKTTIVMRTTSRYRNPSVCHGFASSPTHFDTSPFAVSYRRIFLSKLRLPRLAVKQRVTHRRLRLQ